MLDTIDLLSPPITLFYLEKRTHSSIVGGSFIILLFLFCLSYVIYLLYLVIAHKKVTSLYYKQFEYNIGKYYLNSSSIYFFIQLHSIDNKSYRYNYASKYIRTYTYYGNTDFEESNLDKIDHWVYDSCREGIDNKNLDSSLFKNINNFNSSGCLRYYYNSIERKYYSLEEKGFISPFLANGTSQKNNVFLHTSIQKCTNDSITNIIFDNCPSQEEIDEYSTKIVAIFLYLIDNQIDPTNYNNPIQKYIQSITSGMGTAQSFEESYIFYSPVKVRTKKGAFFEKTRDLETIYYDSNIKLSTSNSDKYFKYTRFTHFIQNNILIYERRYDDYFDILSDIGGIIQCIFNLFYWINYLLNKYIIVSDTNKLFFSMIERRADSLNEEKFKKINRINSKANDSSINYFRDSFKSKTIFGTIVNENNGKNENNEVKNNLNESINKENILNKGETIKLNIMSSKKSSSNSHLNNIINKNKNNNNNNIITKKTKEIHYHSSHKNNYLSQKKSKLRPSFFNKEKRLSDNNPNILKNNLVNQTIKISQLFSNKVNLKKKYSFYEFLKSICSTKINNINFLVKYRKCLLSEEQILKSHINNIILEKKINVDKYQNLTIVDSINF